jgi:hypothetical protein
MRILLVILVLAIGYDAVVHEGANTRNVWASLVSFAGSAVSGAREMTEPREEPRAPSN